MTVETCISQGEQPAQTSKQRHWGPDGGNCLRPWRARICSPGSESNRRTRRVQKARAGIEIWVQCDLSHGMVSGIHVQFYGLQHFSPFLILQISPHFLKSRPKTLVINNPMTTNKPREMSYWEYQWSIWPRILSPLSETLGGRRGGNSHYLLGEARTGEMRERRKEKKASFHWMAFHIF